MTLHDCHDVSYHGQPNWLFNLLFRMITNKSSKPSIGVWNPMVTCGFPWQKANNVEIISMSWHHHDSPGPQFNIKMSSYQYRKSYCGDKIILRPSYLHNGISYIGKMSSLYWIGTQTLPVLIPCYLYKSPLVATQDPCIQRPHKHQLSYLHTFYMKYIIPYITFLTQCSLGTTYGIGDLGPHW